MNLNFTRYFDYNIATYIKQNNAKMLIKYLGCPHVDLCKKYKFAYEASNETPIKDEFTKFIRAEFRCINEIMTTSSKQLCPINAENLEQELVKFFGNQFHENDADHVRCCNGIKDVIGRVKTFNETVKNILNLLSNVDNIDIGGLKSAIDDNTQASFYVRSSIILLDNYDDDFLGIFTE